MVRIAEKSQKLLDTKDFQFVVRLKKRLRCEGTPIEDSYVSPAI